ncbi:unnamed protein product, partial [Iphiclides podalirius]
MPTHCEDGERLHRYPSYNMKRHRAPILERRCGISLEGTISQRQHYALSFCEESEIAYVNALNGPFKSFPLPPLPHTASPPHPSSYASGATWHASISDATLTDVPVSLSMRHKEVTNVRD